MTIGKISNFSEYRLKRIASQSPNFINETILNLYIHQNFPFALVGSGKSSHNHSQHLTKLLPSRPWDSATIEISGALGKHKYRSFEASFENSRSIRQKGADNSIKMLPLTEVKGNF